MIRLRHVARALAHRGCWRHPPAVPRGGRQEGAAAAAAAAVRLPHLPRGEEGREEEEEEVGQTFMELKE